MGGIRMSNNEPKSELVEEKKRSEEETTVTDSKIFLVQVPHGRETQLIFLIKWRAEVLGLPIKAAFAPKSQSGVIFVEADDYDVVVRAVRNFRNAIALREPLSFKDAEQYLREFEVKYEREVVKEEKKIELIPGMIVEIIDGPFKGRKARIVSLAKKKVWVDLMGGGALLIEVDIDHVVPLEE